MDIFYKYEGNQGRCSFNKALLWDYDLDSFDWQRYRAEVVKRTIQMGRLSDYFAVFDLYGGIKAVAAIANNEVEGLSDRDMEFMCNAFHLKIKNTLCYRQKQLRKQLFNS